MVTIRIVLDEDLLAAADRVARRRKVSRTALVREALRGHLANLARREREQADRVGYRRHPEAGTDAEWDEAAAWPEDETATTCAPAASRRR